MKCEHFCNAHCSFDCPNSWFSIAEEWYGDAAYDIGFEHVDCKDCHYNTGKCEDCLFEGMAEYCPKESEVTP